MFLLSIKLNLHAFIIGKKYTSMEIQSMNSKTPEIVYETTFFECSCPDFKFRRASTGKACKHIKALIMERLV